MAEAAKKVTIINQREGKIILAPDPEAVKAFEAMAPEKRSEKDRPKPREILAGRTLEVSAAEAEKLLNHKGIGDAGKILSLSPSSRVAELEKQLAEERAKNAELAKKLGAAAEPAELGDDDEVLLPDGSRGVIVKLKKKGMADVRLENGNVSPFKVADLKPAPAKE